jgi:hypothetical protein
MSVLDIEANGLQSVTTDESGRDVPNPGTPLINAHGYEACPTLTVPSRIGQTTTQ